MVMPKAFYITTPLYYVNAAPHIGHSYTTVAADCLARYHRLNGEPVFFLTGTDEHGQKIEQAARAAGLEPKAFTDQTAQTFHALWKTLNISYDRFIRTTDADHIRVVQRALQHLRPQLRQGPSTFFYCVPCETQWAQSDVADPHAPECPSCRRALEQVEEENFFLPLEPHRQWLKAHIDAHPAFVQPEARRNELLALLEQPLPDLCLTRPTARLSWGIEVPFSRVHVTYVWVDALLNYLTAAGYGTAAFEATWPADVHVIGKDILRHHALYWPILLHALGLPDAQMPRMIFAHGWWTIGEQKMSKSRGNIVDPNVVIADGLKDQPYAADVYRYFLLREVPFGQDGSFSEEAIRKRLETDLANDLGNLLHRTLSMIERYCHGRLPAAGPVGCAVDDAPLRDGALGLSKQLEERMARLDFSGALGAIFQLITRANRYIELQAPWQLAKAGEPARLHTVLAVLTEVIRIVAVALDPFMPSVAEAAWAQLGLGGTPRRLRDTTQWPGVTAGQPIGTRAVLFPKTS